MFTSTTFQGATNSRACSKNFVSFMAQHFCHIWVKNHKRFRFAYPDGAKNERRADERKRRLPLQRVAKPDQERNGINGGYPRPGVEAFICFTLTGLAWAIARGPGPHSEALISHGNCVPKCPNSTAKYGRIDIAFNNAGVAFSVPSEECTDEQWWKVINTDLNSVFYCCREFGGVMLGQGKGSIINTASMSGLISNNPQPQSAYNAAKAGVIMLTKSLAGEWAKRGVRVNCISPGYINTPMTPKGKINNEWYKTWMDFSPMGRIGEPNEIASCVVFLASQASSFFTGSNLVVDGGYTCWCRTRHRRLISLHQTSGREPVVSGLASRGP